MPSKSARMWRGSIISRHAGRSVRRRRGARMRGRGRRGGQGTWQLFIQRWPSCLRMCATQRRSSLITGTWGPGRLRRQRGRSSSVRANCSSRGRQRQGRCAIGCVPRPWSPCLPRWRMLSPTQRAAAPVAVPPAAPPTLRLQSQQPATERSPTLIPSWLPAALRVPRRAVARRAASLHAAATLLAAPQAGRVAGTGRAVLHARALEAAPSTA
mmetsp:Transcript_77022/g.152838  ORF Transcript_77022/g.152838 Transcript_77022/m.152838 type:complete len:212 (+) Transcript_77022:893-1528(+)